MAQSSKSLKERNKQIITLEMPIELVDRMDKLKDSSRSEFVRSCVEAQLDKVDIQLSKEPVTLRELAIKQALEEIEEKIKEVKRRSTARWYCNRCGDSTSSRAGQCPSCREGEQFRLYPPDSLMYDANSQKIQISAEMKRKEV
jgi:rubrerythrin